MVGDMVFKLSACLKGYGVDNKMIVKIIGVKMSGNNNFIIRTPHTPCGFHSDFVCFFGSDFARHKALIPVIGYIAAHFAKAFLGRHHTLIGSLGVAVDTADIYSLIGLFIVGHILQGGIQVLVHILLSMVLSGLSA